MKLLSVKFVVFHQLVALAEGRGMDGATRCFAKGRRLRISIIEGESLEKTNMLLQSKFRRRSPLWSCAVATDWAARHAQGFGGAALEAYLHGDQSGLCSKINGAIRLRSRSRWSDPSTSGENHCCPK